MSLSWFNGFAPRVQPTSLYIFQRIYLIKKEWRARSHPQNPDRSPLEANRHKNPGIIRTGINLANLFSMNYPRRSRRLHPYGPVYVKYSGYEIWTITLRYISAYVCESHRCKGSALCSRFGVIYSRETFQDALIHKIFLIFGLQSGRNASLMTSRYVDSSETWEGANIDCNEGTRTYFVMAVALVGDDDRELSNFWERSFSKFRALPDWKWVELNGPPNSASLQFQPHFDALQDLSTCDGLALYYLINFFVFFHMIMNTCSNLLFDRQGTIPKYVSSFLRKYHTQCDFLILHPPYYIC